MTHDLFQDLLKRVQDGEEEAIGILLSVFEKEIRLIVRHRLPRRLRARYDSMDFVQSVYQSIITDWRSEPPTNFQNPAQVRAYLQAIASNKVLEIYRRETRTQKYDISREVSGLVRGTASAADHTRREKQIDPVSSDPTPSKHVQAQDLMDKLTRGKPAVVARVLILRNEGRTFDEIGKMVGLSERSIRRMVDDLRDSAKEVE